MFFVFFIDSIANPRVYRLNSPECNSHFSLARTRNTFLFFHFPRFYDDGLFLSYLTVVISKTRVPYQEQRCSHRDFVESTPRRRVPETILPINELVVKWSVNINQTNLNTYFFYFYVKLFKVLDKNYFS